MLTAQSEGGFEQRRGRLCARPTGAITGLQRGMGPIGPRLEGASPQVPNRALGQTELGGDVLGRGPEA